MTNQSGLANSSQMLQQPANFNNMVGGGTSMLAMLQMSNPNLNRSNLPLAPVKKKPRPLMGVAYHHQRSKSQDPDTFLQQQQRPLHQRSRSQDPDTLVMSQIYGSQHLLQHNQVKKSHPSLMLHSTPVQQQKQKVCLMSTQSAFENGRAILFLKFCCTALRSMRK